MRPYQQSLKLQELFDTQGFGPWTVDPVGDFLDQFLQKSWDEAPPDIIVARQSGQIRAIFASWSPLTWW